MAYEWIGTRDPVGAVEKAIFGEWNWTVGMLFELRGVLNRKCDAIKTKVEADGSFMDEHYDDDAKDYR
jgi:hypothetical protein